MNRARRKRSNALGLMFIVYAVILADALLRFLVFHSPQISDHAVRLIPLQSTTEFLSSFSEQPEKVVSNLMGNILAFVPMGLFLQALSRKPSIGRSILMSALFSLLAEVSQYFFAVGTLDIDDVLLNTAGGAIGVWLYGLLARRSADYARRVITAASVIVGVPFGGMYLYLFIRRVLLQM